jgi:RNA polymerase sigma-70 factor (ECF subfamily)
MIHEVSSLERSGDQRSLTRVCVEAAHRFGDESLAHALVLRRPDAPRVLLERYTPVVSRVLLRILGIHADHDDLVQEVFARALSRIDQLNDGGALRPWLTGIAVFVAREVLRKRRRARWLFFVAPEEMPEPAAVDANPAAREALRALYREIARFPADEQIAFTLRFVDGMELRDIAEACDISLSTIKRRVRSAEARFLGQARNNPVLQDWIEEGSRWAERTPG